MTHEHYLHPKLLAEPVNIGLAGCGGNGSQMLTGLARLDRALRALRHPGFNVVAFDPDRVTEANVGRQLFSPADVGHYKSAVLVHRLNSFYGMDWRASPNPFDPDIAERLDGLAEGLHIIISCVDTRAARMAIGNAVGHRRGVYYWMDLGNRAADGQVILGIPPWDHDHQINPLRLPTAPELFPEIADPSIEDDDTPSCSLAEALERQELFINQIVVSQALQLLWQLFRHAKTTWHGSFVNAASGRITPLAPDPAAWARFGYFARQHNPDGLHHDVEAATRRKVEVA